MNDSQITDVYNEFASANNCFLDSILCDPDLREPFIEKLHEQDSEDVPEAELLLRLVYLRKRGKLARQKPR